MNAISTSIPGLDFYNFEAIRILEDEFKVENPSEWTIQKMEGLLRCLYERHTPTVANI